MRKYFFPIIIALTALSVSVSAAFYSITGLSKLFAGAAIAVIVMASSLEVAKLVIASLLYQYWNKLNKFLRFYFLIAATVLVIITSIGIYGFLSSAYQTTYGELKIIENKLGFLEQKEEFYKEDVIRYDRELERISENINVLSNAKTSQFQIRDTSVAGGVRQTISTTELRLAQERIEIEEQNKKEVQLKRSAVSDSLQKYQLEILKLENNTEISAELGPLQYISEVTSKPMNEIVNILLLIIIFVFDPLAVSLVVAANFAFNQINTNREEILKKKLHKTE